MMKFFYLEFLAQRKEKKEEKQPIIIAMWQSKLFQALAMYHSQEQSSTALMGDNTTGEYTSTCL